MDLLEKARNALFGGLEANKTELHDPSDQPQEDQELVAYVKQKIEESRSHATRIAHEGIWMTNIAYLLGFDSIYYDPQAKTYRSIDQSSGRPSFVKRNRVRENILLPAAQNRLARMIKSPPKYDVRPEEMTEDQKESARLGIEVINQVFDKQTVSLKRIELGMWLQQCGHAYIGVCFDEDLGEDLHDLEGNWVGKSGEIRIDVVSAFEGYSDPLAKTFAENFWFARCKVRKLDYFKTHYERGYLVKEEGVWLLSQQYEQRINTMNTVGPTSSGTAEQMKGAAIEISFYEKPTKKYRNGRHIICANGVLLKNSELAVGEIPYAKFDDIFVAGKYFSETPVTHARPLQDQYNRTMTKRAQWTNRLLAGKYIAAKGHGLIQEAMNDQSAEVVEYTEIPGQPPPQAMSMPVIPAYAYTETAELKKSVYEMFGLSDVSRGQLPSASIPGKGIELLLEQDETRIGVEVTQHENSWARVGMLVLKYAQKYYVTDRSLKSRGRNQDLVVRKFSGKNILSTDVIVIPGSTVPNSKVIKRQEIINVWQQGLMGNPGDPAVIAKVLEDLEYGEIGKVWEDYHLVMRQIQDDLDLITNEMVQPPVNKFDNHVLHIIHKNRFRLGEKFKMLSPEQQMMLELNMQQHVEMGVAQSNPQLASDPELSMPMPPPPPDVASILQEEQDLNQAAVVENQNLGDNKQ